jgi:hypothetical protein
MSELRTCRICILICASCCSICYITILRMSASTKLHAVYVRQKHVGLESPGAAVEFEFVRGMAVCLRVVDVAAPFWQRPWCALLSRT